MSKHQATDLNVAHTILAQLGGHGRIAAMIGAKDFVGDECSVMFRFSAKASNRANKIVITLDSDDTYRVQFWSIRGMKMQLVNDCPGVYASDLRTTIENKTGLALSL